MLAKISNPSKTMRLQECGSRESIWRRKKEHFTFPSGHSTRTAWLFRTLCNRMKIYSVIQINMVKGCVSNNYANQTFCQFCLDGNSEVKLTNFHPRDCQFKPLWLRASFCSDKVRLLCLVMVRALCTELWIINKWLYITQWNVSVTWEKYFSRSLYILTSISTQQGCHVDTGTWSDLLLCRFMYIGKYLKQKLVGVKDRQKMGRLIAVHITNHSIKMHNSKAF